MNSRTGVSAAGTRFLARPDGRIAYDVQGEGPLLLLVPGMGELRSSYRFLAPALVAAGYRVATADLRGHGESDTTFSSFGDVETADDMRALIEQLGAPAVLVGNSLAAGAAVIVAADHPALVNGLVLLGPFVRNPPVSAFMRAMFRAMMSPLWIAAVWKGYLPTLYAGRKPDDFAIYRQAVVTSLKRKAYAKAFSETTRQLTHDPAEAKLGAVSKPTLVVMGDKDPDFANPAAEAQWIAKALRGEVVMVSDCGHYPQAQQPEITTAAILRFLATVPRG